MAAKRVSRKTDGTSQFTKRELRKFVGEVKAVKKSGVKLVKCDPKVEQPVSVPDQEWVVKTLDVMKQVVSDALDAAGKRLGTLKTFAKIPAKAVVQMRRLVAALSEKNISGQTAYLVVKVLARTPTYRDGLNPLIKSAEWKKFVGRIRPVLKVMHGEMFPKKRRT